MPEDAIQGWAHFVFVVWELVVLPESIIDSIFNTAVKFVIEKMTARVGNDFQEAVHRCLDSLIHWLAGVLVGVGCKEVWDFPDVTSSTHDGVSNHIVEVIARHWPFTDDVAAFNAESSCFIQISDFGHQTAVIIKGSLGGETSVLRTFRMSGKELVKERVSKERVRQGKS